MKKILVLAVLLSFQAFAGGPPGAATGPVTSAETADVLTPSTTLNAVCASPASGCATGQWVTIKKAGRSAIAFTIVDTAFNASVQVWGSPDRGAHWTGPLPYKTNLIGSGGNNVFTNALNDSAVNFVRAIDPMGSFTDLALVVSAYTSGTAVAVGSATNTTPFDFWNAVAGKGSLPSAYPTVQLAKDGGRTYVALSADGVTPAIAETVVTFTKTVADTQTAAQTSYTITSGKQLRIQAICASFTAGAAANRVRVALRMNTGGACVAGSNILIPVAELAPNYGTATASEGGSFVCQPIPDGLEITGNGTKAICLSENAVAASGTLTINLVSYEY